MAVEEKIAQKKGAEKRDETLGLNKIDTDYLSRLIEDQLDNFQVTHQRFYRDRQDWMAALRDLKYKYKEGFFEHSSDLHIPYTLIMSKAMHAKIFQVFSQQNFFGVEANNIAFKDREELITRFMNWVLGKWMNRGRGKSDVIDNWIQDILDEGSGVLKLFWDNWEHTFEDVDVETVEEEDIDILEALGGGEIGEDGVPTQTTAKARVKNVKKTIKHAAPRAGTVNIDDFFMPPGFENVQTAPWCAHRVFLRDEDLKFRAQRGRFDKEVVEEAIERRKSLQTDRDLDRGHQTRRATKELEGISTDETRTSMFEDGTHTIIEWYGRAYVVEDMDEETFEDPKTLPQEIVVWWHKDLRKVLGWTYLHRISPSGKRPLYKADFMPSKERSIGMGIAELLWPLNNHIDGVHNLKMDNGVLASLQFGVYRSGSTFKPDTFRIQPGELIPVEDTNDFKWTNIPYLGQFGEQEELTLTGYGEKLLAINDINLGNLTGRGVAGALRNATGANFVDRQANIQMHPHLDRIARELKDFLADLFILTRSRMDDDLYFRVTGEDGKGIFGEVRREDLRGDFDFTINVDLAASSEAERQQRSSLMIQTLLNPTFMQTGVVQPGNIYEMLKEFLIRHNIQSPDAFITKPQGYTGPPLTPDQRIFKILMDQHDKPPIEASVRPEEDHEAAIKTLEAFRDSDLFGVLDQDQLAAFSAVQQAHVQFQALLGGGAQGVPNTTGTQLPGQGGLPGLSPQAGPGGVPDADGSEGGPLGSPLGEVNGPVQ